MRELSAQQKANASERLGTLFNSINNEIKTSFQYIGSMRRGEGKNPSLDINGNFDIDADIKINLKRTTSAQETYSDFITIIKRSLRSDERMTTKTNTLGYVIISIWSTNNQVDYSFDLAIKDENRGSITKNGNAFSWEK